VSPRGKQPETAIRKAVRDYLRLRGWKVYTILQGIGAHRGISDLVAKRRDQVAFIEIKTPTGRQSDLQMEFEAEIMEDAGFHVTYVVIRSIEEVIEWEQKWGS